MFNSNRVSKISTSTHTFSIVELLHDGVFYAYEFAYWCNGQRVQDVGRFDTLQAAWKCQERYLQVVADMNAPRPTVGLPRCADNLFSFPADMPKGRVWTQEAVLSAVRKQFENENSKVWRFFKEVADWTFSQSDHWKDPVRLNMSFLEGFPIAWVDAVIVWYHAVEPKHVGSWVESQGYGA
jgi:hypothetical protein